jgi:hypothetical protein
MTVTIELPLEIETSLLAQAEALGLDVTAYLQNLLREQITARTGAATTSRPADELPEEWVHRFTAWSEGPAHANLPDLPDDALSRESIYADRGW